MNFKAGFMPACTSIFGANLLRQTSLVALLTAALFPCTWVSAQQTAGTEHAGFALSGFGTLGAARSSNPDAELLRDVSQPDGAGRQWSAKIDSIVGLQGNLHLRPDLELVAQVVSHYRQSGNFAPELTWAFAKYDLNPRFSFRVGRIGTEFLMQSDSRMVGYSYLPVRPSVDFFGGIPINYADGADVQVRWPMGDGVFRASAFTGVARESLRTYNTNGSPAAKGSLGYDTGPWQLRYIYARARLANSVDSMSPLLSTLSSMGASGIAKTLDFKGSLSAYNSLGVSYDDGAWQAQAAIDAIQHQTASIENSKAGYLLVGRRLGSWSPYAGYSQSKSTPKPLNTGFNGPNFDQLNQGLNMVSTRSHQDGKTLTLGARWDFAQNMDLKFQLDRTTGGKPPTALLFSNVQPGWNGKTTVLSVALDFVF